MVIMLVAVGSQKIRSERRNGSRFGERGLEKRYWIRRKALRMEPQLVDV